MKTHLYIARHGETQWNKVQRFQGRLDSKLTEQGKQQSAEVAQQVLNKNIDRIFSSNLGRATHSAEICQKMLNVDVEIIDELTERHLGDWQGKQIKILPKDDSYHEILYQFTALAPQGGESAIRCGERVYSALENIVLRQDINNGLIIFHGEALRCFFALLGKHSSQNAYELFKNGSVTALFYDHNDKTFHLVTTQD